MSNKALVIIDLQNDYFKGGNYPLHNADGVLANIKQAIKKAEEKQISVILIQHIVPSDAEPAPFFNQGTEGVKIHPEILAVAPNAPIVVKTFADSFEQTNLEQTLQQLSIDEIILCGMMTQNCVTHTALSKAAEKYDLSILEPCCTTIDMMINAIALKAISTRIPLVSISDL